MNKINKFEVGDHIILIGKYSKEYKGKTFVVEEIHPSNYRISYQVLLDSQFNEDSVISNHYTLAEEFLDFADKNVKRERNIEYKKKLKMLNNMKTPNLSLFT